MPSSFLSMSGRESSTYTPYSPDPSYPYPMTPHTATSGHSSFFPADRPRSSWRNLSTYTQSIRFSMLRGQPPVDRAAAPTPNRAAGATPYISVNTNLTSPTWEKSKFSPYTEIDLEEPRTPPSSAPPPAHHSWPRTRSPSVFRPSSHVSKEGRIARMSRMVFGPPSPTTPSTGDLESAPLAEPEVKMEQQTPLSAWPALNVAKRPVVPSPATARLQQAFPTPAVPVRSATYNPRSAEEEMARRQREVERRRRGWCVLIVFILLVVILLAILLPLTLIPAIRPSDSTPSAAPSTPTPISGLSGDAAECLSSFRLTAPADPGSYPCSTCLAPLRAVPASALTNATDAQAVGDAIQFCALKAVFDSAGGKDSALAQVGWLKNLETCTYPGVSCTGTSGRVTSLELTFPGVPAVIPAELAVLTMLQNLKITGNGAIPAGPFPTAASLPPAIMKLEIVNTALVGPLDAALFSNGPLSDATSLTLVGNTKLGTTLPDSLNNVPLTSLIVNGQSLDIDLNGIFNSPAFSRTLQTLSLASNAIASPLAGPISLNALTSLDLSSNDITLVVPSSSFPPSLVTLNLSDNPGLLGTLPPALCGSTVLQNCDIRKTLFPATTQCGACKFA